VIRFDEPRRSHLAGLIRLFQEEGWPSFAGPERTMRALTAPGTICVVATDGDEVVGVAHALTDGEIASFLSVLLVGRERRRQGIGRALIAEMFARIETDRCDLLTDTEAMPFYSVLPHRELVGVRLYREPDD